MTFFSYKYISQCAVCVATVCVLLGLTACADELFPTESTEQIRFIPSVSDSWSSMPKGRQSKPRKLYEAYNVTPIADSKQTFGKQLYLHEQVQDGFVTADPKITSDSELRSRAAHMVMGPEDFYNEIGVAAYVYEDGEWSDVAGKANYFRNEKIAKDSDGSYNLQSKFFWPNQPGKKMRFAAYAPFQEEIKDVWTMDAEMDDGVTPFAGVSYITNFDLSKQVDLLIAISDEFDCTNPQPVHLNFRHALAAVRFETGGGLKGATIKRIAFDPIWYNGIINIETGTMDKLWGAGNFFVEPNKYIATDAITDILDGQVMLFPPYTSTTWTYLRIDFEVGGTNRHVDLPFFAKKWEGGKTYTYRLTNSQYSELMSVEYGDQNSATGEVHIHAPYNGGSPTFRLNSTIGGFTPQPLAWKAYFQPEGSTTWSETAPDWLSLSMTNGSGDVGEGTQITANFKPEPYVEVDLDASLLKSCNGSSTQRYNLATQRTDNRINTTANCYVANRWGYYMLPCVYGNAITNGGTNTAAYTAPYDGAGNAPHDEGDILYKFVDHLGRDISAPLIDGHAYGRFTIKEAKLLWEDVDGLVTNVEYKSGLYQWGAVSTGGIVFDIPQGNAKQGNAVIALYDTNGNIIWSWHIWVTPLGGQYTIPIQTAYNQQLDIDAVNLGWVSFNPIKDYRARTCKVRFVSLTEDTSVEVTFGQEPHAILAPGDGLFYQWGRKDPFRGVNRSGVTVLPAYDWPNLNIDKKSLKRDLLAWRTKHPATYHQISRKQGLTAAERADLDILVNITDDMFMNLWNSSNAGTNNGDHIFTTKTVYDPCPPGFKVAPPCTFTGMTATGWGIENDMSKWSGTWDYEQKGFMAKSTADHLLTVLFPTCGYMDYDDFSTRLYNRGTHSYIWTAGSFNHSCAKYYWFYNTPDNNYINPFDHYLIGDGFSVRGVKE